MPQRTVLRSEIQVVITPLAIFIKSVPQIILKQFQQTIPVPVMVNSQITWRSQKETFFRHRREPYSTSKCIQEFFDLKMVKSNARLTAMNKLAAKCDYDRRGIENLPPKSRWTQFGAGCWPVIRELLVNQGYELLIKDQRPPRQVLLQSINQAHYDSLDTQRQELATRWAQECMAWTQHGQIENYQFAAELAMLYRRRNIVLVMAANQKELEGFTDFFGSDAGTLIHRFEDSDDLLPQNIYLTTPRYGLPLHCVYPITLIVLTAEKMLNHQQFIEWCFLFPTSRRYGIISAGAQITTYDRELLKIMFGSCLSSQHEPHSPATTTSYQAQLNNMVNGGITCNDQVAWKRSAIWTNVSRNQLIANLTGYLDKTNNSLAPAITLVEHCAIRERRGANKHTLILVENDIHGQQLQALLPEYSLIALNCVNNAGFVPPDERYQESRGAILTLPAYDALQAYGADLVIRADGCNAVLDFAKTIIPWPFQPLSQTVIEITGPGHHQFRNVVQQ